MTIRTVTTLAVSRTITPRPITVRPWLNRLRKSFTSRSHDAVIHVYDEADNVIETHEQAADFREF